MKYVLLVSTLLLSACDDSSGVVLVHCALPDNSQFHIEGKISQSHHDGYHVLTIDNKTVIVPSANCFIIEK